MEGRGIGEGNGKELIEESWVENGETKSERMEGKGRCSRREGKVKGGGRGGES